MQTTFLFLNLSWNMNNCLTVLVEHFFDAFFVLLFTATSVRGESRPQTKKHITWNFLKSDTYSVSEEAPRIFPEDSTKQRLTVTKCSTTPSCCPVLIGRNYGVDFCATPTTMLKSEHNPEMYQAFQTVSQKFLITCIILYVSKLLPTRRFPLLRKS